MSTAFPSIKAAPTGITAIPRFRNKPVFTDQSSSSPRAATSSASITITSCCCPIGATRTPKRSSAISNSQLRAAHARHLYSECRDKRLLHNGRRSPRVGQDAHEPNRHPRRFGRDLYLPDQRPAAGGQLDGIVPPGREGAAALHQRLVDEHFRR